MALKALEYFYDSQMARFLAQIVRAFSGFQYMTGYNANGSPQLIQVPATLALQSNMVANIIQNSSANTLLTCPAISISNAGVRYMPEMAQNLKHIDTRQVVERGIDENGNYTNLKGNAYTVERIMPRPFEMDIRVDIWTSTQDQKYQLFEQILTVFCPQIDIQNSTNPLDWTAITTMMVQDIEWTSVTIPIGSNSAAMDIGTIRLKLPFWLNPPAKVKQQKLIETIVSNIYDATDQGPDECFGTFLTRDIVTPGDHNILVQGNTIKLLNGNNDPVGSDGLPFSWVPLLELYGMMKPTISKIFLRTSYNELNLNTYDYSGTIQYNPSNVSELIWNIDLNSLPNNTQASVNGIIDPNQTYPGRGLPTLVAGQRYIILNNIISSDPHWGGFSAFKNDIIEWNGISFLISYSPPSNENNDLEVVDFVVNAASGNQLRWNGENWVKSIDGIYERGLWGLSL